MLSKKLIKPVEGRDYTRLPNGVLRVSRQYGNLMEPYSRADIPDVLSAVDHSLAIEKRKEYEALLREETAEFYDLVGKLAAAKRSMYFVFQGRDSAGKSGAIERIVQAIDYDFKNFAWVTVGKPTDEELAHPFLWRFQIGDRIPKFGQVRAMDRSWNERVLVEVVDDLATKQELRESFGMIRVFEWMRHQEGALFCKIWMDITKDEQARRFEARKKEKPRKATEADEDARKKWPLYTVAANEMLYRTSTPFAPWNVVSSQDKRYSRVTVLQLGNEVMRAAL